MNSIRKMSAVAVVSCLQFLTIPALAQLPGSGNEERPSSSGTPADPVPGDRAPSLFGTPRSLDDASNPTGKSSGTGTLKELRFPAVDANSDGAISLSEFTVFMEAGNTTPRNSSGVSPTELLFRQIDTDGNGSLSEAEVTAYQDAQARR